MIYIIITTIQTETDALQAFRNMPHTRLVLIGDKKTPAAPDIISIKSQNEMRIKSKDTTPLNHYARKNIGYISAIKSGAFVIYDTDDDNIPLTSTINAYPFDGTGKIIKSNSPTHFTNVYRYFNQSSIWARGFPLSQLNSKNNDYTTHETYNIGVWQAVVNGDPDVDSVYRLTTTLQDITFHCSDNHIVLGEHTYSPFNSQSTLWRKECFPLLYLPITVTFRFTDILRSFIAQRIMWEHGYKIGFCNPIAFQKRNKHNLMKDFQDEIPMFLNTERIISNLEDIKLSGNMYDNLMMVYELLLKENVVKDLELVNLSNWIQDIK